MRSLFPVYTYLQVYLYIFFCRSTYVIKVHYTDGCEPYADCWYLGKNRSKRYLRIGTCIQRYIGNTSNCRLAVAVIIRSYFDAGFWLRLEFLGKIALVYIIWTNNLCPFFFFFGVCIFEHHCLIQPTPPPHNNFACLFDSRHYLQSIELFRITNLRVYIGNHMG